MSEIDWAQIARDLQAPFPEGDVKTKPGRGGKLLSYIDRSLVAERLDAVVGPQNWYFDWLPMVGDTEQIRVVKGTLTIYGISKSDVGDAADGDEPNKSAVSDAFKRVAALWGIGRYLARKTAPASAQPTGQQAQRAVVAQDARPRPQATPNAPTPIRAASVPASAPPESAGAAFKRAASTAGLSEDEQKALIKQTYPNRGFSTLTEAEWHKLEQKCRAMYSDVPAPEEAPLF